MSNVLNDSSNGNLSKHVVYIPTDQLFWYLADYINTMEITIDSPDSLNSFEKYSKFVFRWESIHEIYNHWMKYTNIRSMVESIAEMWTRLREKYDRRYIQLLGDNVPIDKWSRDSRILLKSMKECGVSIGSWRTHLESFTNVLKNIPEDYI